MEAKGLAQDHRSNDKTGATGQNSLGPKQCFFHCSIRKFLGFRRSHIKSLFHRHHWMIVVRSGFSRLCPEMGQIIMTLQVIQSLVATIQVCHIAQKQTGTAQ
jgi:hypothetical protein